MSSKKPRLNRVWQKSDRASFMGSIDPKQFQTIRQIATIYSSERFKEWREFPQCPRDPFPWGSTAIFCWYLWCVCVENHWPLHVCQFTYPAKRNQRLLDCLVLWCAGWKSSGLPKKTFLGFGRHCTVMHSLSRPVKLPHSRWKECIAMV